MADYIFGAGSAVTTASGTTGNDTYTITGTTAAPVTGILVAQAGDDIVNFDNFNWGGSALDLGEGNNTLTGTNGSGLTISGGAGNDSVTLTNVDFNALRLGGGDNTAVLTDSSVTGTTILSEAGVTGNTVSLTLNNSTTGALVTNGSNATIDVSNGSVIQNIVAGGSIVSEASFTLNINDSTVTGNILKGEGDFTINAVNADIGAIGLANDRVINPEDTIDLNFTNSTIDSINVTTGGEAVFTNTVVNGRIFIGGNDGEAIHATFTDTTLGAKVLSYFGDDTFILDNVIMTDTNVNINGNLGDDTFVILDFAAGDIALDGGYGDNDTLDLSKLPYDYTVNITNTILQGTQGLTAPEAYDGTVTYTDDAGMLHTISFTRISTIVVDCFTAGTFIETENGNVLIEDIVAGQMVRTLDHGFQPVRWIGKSTVDGIGKNAPVMIKAGALGNEHDFMVSQNHRMLISDWRAEVLFGEEEILVPAKSLVNGDTIYVQPTDRIEYIHMMFDKHEVVFAEGVATESFFAGSYNLSKMESEVLEELVEIFPELDANRSNFVEPSRMTINSTEAKALFL